jgi:dihydroorotate dehydrogenase
LAISLLKLFLKLPFSNLILKNWYQIKSPQLGKKVFGLNFPNSVGLAAGFDKNATFIDEFALLGFGFIEIGTVTPKPQPGNDKPRLFRLPKDHALINRMGFNNDGIEVVAQRLKKRKSSIIVGGNIGKNKVTPNEEAYKDYLICYEALFEVVDYFVVNVSSPNTPGLRSLQEKGPLTEILNKLQLANLSKKIPKPILLKIAPDLTDSQLDDIIEIVQETKINGVIATNTTISRADLKTSKSRIEEIGLGGLSGIPVKKRSTDVINYLATKSNHAFPIIGVGGIHSPIDAIEKINAGADLIQLYTGFIYEGPSLVANINKLLLKQ